MDNNKQKEEFIKRLLAKDEEEKPTKNRLLGIAIDLNGNGMEYKYKKTTIKG